VIDRLLTQDSERARGIARRHGAVRLRVFGSWARSAGGETSDLDVLADFEPGRSLLDLIGLKQDLEVLLGCKVDVVTEDSLSPYLREQILRQAREL
jgi:predicted nucleotidyltransferase